MRARLAALWVFVGCAFAGCASDPSAPPSSAPEATAPDTAAPADSVALGAPAPEASGGGALEAALRERYGPDDGEVRYLVGWVDLDGDGTNEAVAHVVGPLVCGSGGCATLVFTPGAGGGLRLVSETTVSRTPVVALPERTEGWRDLAVAVGGGGARGGFARLRFDGEAYPGNPTVAPAEPLAPEAGAEAPAGDVVIGAFGAFADARPLR